ncbi:hypothetical protein Droror1_Dr00008404 [Drosera rotundifolia]
MSLSLICTLTTRVGALLLIRTTAHEQFPLSPNLFACSHQCSILQRQRRRLRLRARCKAQYAFDDFENKGTVEDLRIPQHWLLPSTARKESEWLRVALHKWLDDEYCPEDTNIVISKVAADSYYRSLLQNTTDLGEILLLMIRELETISYQESFHGAFSSANAALSLIAQRIEENHLRISTKADKLDAPILENETQIGLQAEVETSIKLDGNVDSGVSAASSSVSPALEKDLKKVVNKAAATFAPRASMATKNPAVPGTALYMIFEVQGYASMLLGGVLSFNLIFPSNEPDIWRLMGMWSIWMFTIPSLRARDCSNKEKEALNYLFLLIPLLNVIIPFFVKSFAVVWSADTIAFFAMYAWKLGWLQNKN